MKKLPEKVKDLVGRQSFWDEVFERIGEGDSLRGVARDFGISYSTLHDRIHEEEGRKRRYLEALTSRAMHHAARIEELVGMVEAGTLDHQSAKVAIDARKWIASRFHPQQFSERLAMEARVQKVDFGALHLQALKEINSCQRSLEPAKSETAEA